MSAELGEYKGLPIAGHALALKGAGEGLSKAMRVSPTDLEPGEEIDLLVRAKAGNVLMRVDDIDLPKNWTVEQSLTAQTITIVSRDFAEAKIADQLLAEAKLKEADNRKKGIDPFPAMALDKGPLITVDGSGVQIVGEAEIAAARERGDVVVETTRVIAQMDDDPDRRVMWPDDFGDLEPRPMVGLILPSGQIVTQLLDPVTGDVLDPSAEKAKANEGGDDDALIDDAPAGDSIPLPAGDVDPALTGYLAGTAAEIKVRLAGVMSVQWLDGLYDAEMAGDNRKPALNAIKARLAEIEGV